MVPPRNLSAICLTRQQMDMGSNFEKYLQRYVFPCLCLLGIIGNCLNLTVLLNKRMRSRSNTFLALLAVSDCIFLSLLLPNILASIPFFTYNYHFRLFFFYSKVHLFGLRELVFWSSDLECRSHVPSYKIRLILFALVVFPFVLTGYQHFAHVCLVRKNYCGSTQVFALCLSTTQDRWINNSSNPYDLSFRRFIRISKLINVVFVIIVPIVLLTILNMCLLGYLRKRSENLQMSDEMSAKPCVDKQKHLRTEQRVSFTVTLIVTLFTLTNGPSAVDQLLQMAYPTPQPMLWYDISLLISTLVIIGKSSNFIVFCLFSKSFRNRLFSLAQKKVHEKLGTMKIVHFFLIFSFSESRRKSSFMPKASLAGRKETTGSKLSSNERSL
ncbi:G-PROTEIN-RECEP-F1-2 domain-containing protein [Aphelenchoides besseyi]|nr:G-PROTEIN-RECEP-F1-2 domain-containing protein [Aphelenchoides besseyi]